MTQIAGNSFPMPSMGSPQDELLIRTKRRRFNPDTFLHSVSFGAAVTVFLMLLALVIVLVQGSIPSIKAFGLGFLTESDWRTAPTVARDPATNKFLRDAEGHIVHLPGHTYGALAVIYGTAITSLIALILAVPPSLAAAIFLNRIAPRWLAAPLSFLIEFLAAIPSLAYGLWGMFVLRPLLRDHIEPSMTAIFGTIPGLKWLTLQPDGTSVLPSGNDMLAGGMILAIMILPIITAVSRDVLRAVPRAQIEGTVALGATWWQSCVEMLKFSRSGLFGAITLGLARAAGETMAVTMVIGITTQIRFSPFMPAQTMSSLLAVSFGEVSDDLEKASLVEVALILLVMSLAFNLVARYLVVGKDSRTSAAHEMIAGTFHTRFSRLTSKVMLAICIALTALIVSLLVIITGYIAWKGISGLTPAFFTHLPDQEPPGILNGIYGTAVLLLLASLIGVPLGLLCGIYLSEYDRGSYIATQLRFVCDLLAGVPSIVVGVLGYELLVVPMHHNNGWAGALALAFIMVPIIARTTEEMLRLVPGSYREASIALGATKARTILRVVLPSASGSIATGVMLAIARVAGETAPLIFTAGLVSRLESNPSNPFPSITAQIYLDFRNSPDPARQSLAWAGILVLIGLIFSLNLCIRFATRTRK